MKGFPEGVCLHEDLYLWAKIAVNYPIAFSPVSLATYHKFEEDSTCLNRVVKKRDFLFYDYLCDLIEQEKLSTEELIHIKGYLNQWLVRDAVKAGCASDANMAKACLKLYRRDSFFEKLKLMTIYLYVRSPGRVQRGARSMGYRFKSLVRKFTVFRLASST
jgi:hypothetical protein